MPNRPRQHGFTIIELLVTMTILGLMLFLVNMLFNDTSRAVTTSVQVSKAVAASRSINEQLTIDEGAMIGPDSTLTNEGGYIVIIQQRLPQVAMLNPQTLAENEFDVPLRTDQLLFIRDAEGLRSMTPSGANRYGTNIIGQAGDRAKVWLGHVQRTNPDGTVPGTAAAFQLGGASARLDRIGSDFILGRQAMLFNPASLDTTTPGGDTYANNALYTSAVENLGTGAPGNQTWNGLTDVTAQDYSNLLFNLADISTAANHTNNYLSTAYPNAANRLRVNPSPSADDTGFASWAIAQGHPIFAPGCSEVIIEFAADLNGNGRIDREFGGGTDNAGAIWWYDGIDQSFMGDAGNNGTWEQQTGLIQPQVTDNANVQQFIFRVDDDRAYDRDAGGTQAHSYWPYLIRIRYRLHDTRGRLTSNYADALRDGIDNDGDGSNTDPDEDRISGRWFERIISVPRP